MRRDRCATPTSSRTGWPSRRTLRSSSSTASTTGTQIGLVTFNGFAGLVVPSTDETDEIGLCDRKDHGRSRDRHRLGDPRRDRRHRRDQPRSGTDERRARRRSWERGGGSRAVGGGRVPARHHRRADRRREQPWRRPGRGGEKRPPVGCGCTRSDSARPTRGVGRAPPSSSAAGVRRRWIRGGGGGRGGGGRRPELPRDRRADARSPSPTSTGGEYFRAEDAESLVDVFAELPRRVGCRPRSGRSRCGSRWWLRCLRSRRQASGCCGTGRPDQEPCVQVSDTKLVSLAWGAHARRWGAGRGLGGAR